MITTFRELWETIEDQNNLEERDKVTMSKDNFKKAIKYAYQTGAATRSTKRTVGDYGPMGDVFDKFFNGGSK